MAMVEFSSILPADALSLPSNVPASGEESVLWLDIRDTQDDLLQ